MAQPFRVRLAASIKQRASSAEKDSLAVNIFYDAAKGGDVYATKRPGTSSYHSGAGTANGIFTYGTNLYIFQNGSYTPTVVAE